MGTTEQVDKKVPNPTGKGGFGDNPQNRNPGGWNKENTISYQYRRFLNMTPEELEEWAKTPKSERTVAMDLAYKRILEGRTSLADIKEITDRTEGKAVQLVDMTVDETLKQTRAKIGGFLDDTSDPDDAETSGSEDNE